MQGLAEFIMRGRRQATLVVGLSVAVPLLFWFGAVVLALVLLRRGWSEGMSVVVWGEFGRTPKVNGNAGRDHWYCWVVPRWRCYCVSAANGRW